MIVTLNLHIFLARMVDFVSLIANCQKPVFPEVLYELLLINCLRGEINHTIVVLISHNMIGPTLTEALCEYKFHLMLSLVDKITSS